MGTDVGWPAHLAGDIVLGNQESGIGVCCLWTNRRKLAAGLDLALYAALGNLYSAGGIGPMVRNLLANPSLRYLVVCGVDLTHSGDALVALFQAGLDDQHTVAGTSVPFDPEVPAWAVNLARERVRLVDLRGETSAERLNAALAALPRLAPLGEALLFPNVVPSLDILPSEGAGFAARQQTVAQAWIECLKLATQFGARTLDPAHGPVRELLHLTVSVWEPPDRLGLPSWLPVQREALDAVAAALAAADARPTGRLARAVADLERQLSSMHSASVSMAGPRRGMEEFCCSGLQTLFAAEREGKLLLSAVFGRQEFFREWPRDALALRTLQGRLAARLGLEARELVLVSGAALLPEAVLEETREVTRRHGPRVLAWRSDPRGIFRVWLEGEEIVVEHGVEQLGPSGRRYRARSANRLYKSVVNDHLVLLPEHAAYLGAELQKAEIALQLGIPYRQDETLGLPSR